MFSFVTRYLGFLKRIPLVPLLFDSLLEVWTAITNRKLLRWLDEIEAELLTWEGVHTSLHKYGGLQFNFSAKEIGHIHSNGIVDILLTRQIKQNLMKNSRIENHHLFKDSGWISFRVLDKEDSEFAKQLLWEPIV